MNCCNHSSNNSNGNNGDEKHAHKGHMSHMWMMALCCGAPLLLLLAVSLLGTSAPWLKALLISAAPFICPIMMVGMIPMMFKHGKHEDNCHEEKISDQNSQPDIPKRNRLN